MKNITEKELSAYSDLLGQEKAAVDKFNFYAQNVKEQEIKKLCKEEAPRHQEHFNAVLNKLN